MKLEVVHNSQATNRRQEGLFLQEPLPPTSGTLLLGTWEQGWEKPGFFLKKPARWVLLGFFLGGGGFIGFFLNFVSVT
jgi:hypothetical protein